MKYIDTSAFVKNYSQELEEKGAEKISAEIRKAKQGKEILLSSIILIGETVSVFDKWLRQGLVDQDGFDKILTQFVIDIKELHETGGLLLEINPVIFLLSIELVLKYHLHLNDATHLYTALSWMPTNTEFVSADRNLNIAAKNESFKIINPEDHEPH